MNKSLKRLILLFALVSVLVCGLIFAVACNPEEQGGEESKISYSVTVTAPSDLDLTTVKAQWKKNGESAGEKTLSAEGKASIELVAGDYTVELSGYDADKYQSQAQSVTKDAPDTTIAITAKIATHNVLVTVANDTGVDLPATAAVQAYNGDSEYGNPVTISNGRATVTVPQENGYVGLVGVDDYLGCEKVSVEGASSTATLTVSLQQVEYTVNVTANGADLTGVKAELWAAGAQEATATADVTEGKATLTATAGSYTVKLTGVPAAYEYEEASVTIEDRTADIELTAIVYKVTIADLPANIVDADIAGLQVQLVDGEGAPYGETVAFTDKQAQIQAPAANYTVEISGAEGIDGVLTQSLTADSREAEVRLGKVAEAYGASGDYVVTTGADGGATVTVQSGSEESLYVFKWSVYGGATVTVSNAGEGNVSIEGQIFFILSGEEEKTFTLQYSPAGEHKFIITCQTSAAPESGDITNPIAEELDNDHKLPEGSERTSAYFKLYAADEGEFALKVEADVEVYYFGTQLKETALPEHKLENGSHFTIETDETYVYFFAKLADTAAEDAVLQFTVSEYVVPGSYPVNPFILPYNQEEPYTFPMGTDVPDVWYAFTAPKTGDYRLSETNGNPDFRPTVYAGYTGKGSHSVGANAVTPSATAGYHLEADKTYYIHIPAISGTAINIKIEDYVAQPGEAGNPIEASETGATPNTVEIKFGENVYFKHTVKTESLNEDGDFVLEFDPHPSALESVFYKDSTYSDTYDTLGYNVGNGKYSTEISGLHEGDVVYFYIKANETSATFYINKPEATENENEIEVGKTVTYSHVDGGGDAMHATFALASSVKPGDYVLEYSVDPNPYIYGKINVTVGSFSVSYPETGAIPVPDSINITIPDGATSIQISTTTGGAPDTYVWSFTLKVPQPTLTVDSPLSVDISGSSATIALDVPAGSYQLAYDFGMSVYSATIIVDIGGGKYYISTPFSGGQTGTVDIEVPDGVEEMTLNIQNAGGATTLTLTLTAAAPVEPEDTELTVGTPTEVTITPDESYNVNLTITLSNVPAGTYNFEFSTESAIFLSLNNWYVVIGETQVQFAKEGDGYIGPVEITIPDGCTEISITSSGIGAPLTATVTLTAVGGPVGPEEPQQGDITVGTGKQVELTADSWGISNEMTVYLEAGKTYQVSLTVPDGKTVHVNDINSKTNATGDHLYTSGGNPAQFTVAESGLVELKVVDSDMAGGFSVTILIEEVGGSGGPQEPQQGDLTVGVETPITDVGVSFADKTVYLTAGTYTITLSGVDAGYIQVNNYSDDNNTVISAGALTGTLTVTEDGIITLRFLNSLWDNQAKTFSVLITASSSGGPEENNITVGESAQVVIPSGYDGVNKTVYLEAGTYTITVTGDFENVVAIGEETGTLGESGTILNPDGERVAMFTVETAGQYTLNFQDTTGAGITISVLIEVSEESEEPDLTLGEAGTVTLTGIGSPEEVIITIQLEEGWYNINIEGDMANVMVVDSSETTVVNRAATGEFSVDSTGLFVLTFRYFGTTPLTLTVTITAQ